MKCVSFTISLKSTDAHGWRFLSANVFIRQQHESTEREAVPSEPFVMINSDSVAFLVWKSCRELLFCSSMGQNQNWSLGLEAFEVSLYDTHRFLPFSALLAHICIRYRGMFLNTIDLIFMCQSISNYHQCFYSCNYLHLYLYYIFVYKRCIK